MRNGERATRGDPFFTLSAAVMRLLPRLRRRLGESTVLFIGFNCFVGGLGIGVCSSRSGMPFRTVRLGMIW